MSSLTVQELALVFTHTCSRPAQDSQRNSVKHLEVEKIDTQINFKSEMLKTENSVGSDNPNGSRRINTPKNPDYPTLFNTCRILSASITQRAYFRGMKFA